MTCCDKIREILMTSYIDSELDEAKRRELDSHIEKCRACRELRDILVKDINGALAKGAFVKPPSDVWGRISEKISPVTKEDAGNLTMWDRIRHSVLRPIPVFAGTAIAFTAVFLIFISVMNTRGPVYDDLYIEGYLGRQIRFIDYLDSNGRDYYPKDDHIGILAPIEKYLF